MRVPHDRLGYRPGRATDHQRVLGLPERTLRQAVRRSDLAGRCPERTRRAGARRDRGGAGSLPAIRRLSGRERLGLLAIGIIGGGIPFALFFEGLALSSSPAAAVIHKTLFLWVAVLAVPFLGERFGLLPIAALVLLLTGTVMLAPRVRSAAAAGRGS